MSSIMKMLAERFQRAKDELNDARVVGEAGAGLVRVTANGQREIVGVEIDPELLKPENKTMIQDLVLAASADAQRKATDLAMQKLGPLTAGLPLPPGLFS